MLSGVKRTGKVGEPRIHASHDRKFRLGGPAPHFGSYVLAYSSFAFSARSITLMIVSNGCSAYRIKPERDKFRATPKRRVGRPTVWSAESALLLKARFWEPNGH